MAVSYTEEAKFPLNEDAGGNWGAIINGVLEMLDRGLELTFTAGEDISEGDVVALKASDGMMYKALATSETLTPPIGIAPNDVDNGEEGKVLGFGWIDVHTSYTGDSIEFTAGDAVYVGSTAGRVAATRSSWGSVVGTVKTDTDSSWDTRILVRPHARQAELFDQVAIDKQAHFTEEVNLGNLGSVETIDWTQGNNQGGILNDDLALSFTAPGGPAHLTFRIAGDAVGGHTVTWPVAVKWASGGTPQAVSLAATYTDIFCAYYDGNGSYYGSLATSFV